MSKVSFEKPGANTAVIDVQSMPVVDIPGIQPATAPEVVPATSIPSQAVTVPSTATAVAPPAPPMFNDEDISFDDIIVPRLNIVQKVGDLSNVFSPGEIVLNQSLVIHVPANKEKAVLGTGPLVVIPLGFKRTVYVEKVKGGGRGAYCQTRDEVVALHGTIDYREWKASLSTTTPKKRFEPLATGLFLVQRPESIPDTDHQLFTHEIGGVYYALAFWSMKGTAYTGAAKRFFTERKIGFLKRPPATSPLTDRGYPSFAWSLTTKLESYPGDDGGTNYAVVPIITPGPKSSDALLDYVKNGIGLQ